MVFVKFKMVMQWQSTPYRTLGRPLRKTTDDTSKDNFDRDIFKKMWPRSHNTVFMKLAFCPGRVIKGTCLLSIKKASCSLRGDQWKQFCLALAIVGYWSNRTLLAAIPCPCSWLQEMLVGARSMPATYGGALRAWRVLLVWVLPIWLHSRLTQFGEAMPLPGQFQVQISWTKMATEGFAPSPYALTPLYPHVLQPLYHHILQPLHPHILASL